jgi:hypothetical protein
MICPHCNNPASEEQPFSVAVEGGRAYARLCVVCGHVLSVRPREDADPALVPDGLNDQQIARLQFVRWRLNTDIDAQVRPDGSSTTGSSTTAA